MLGWPTRMPWNPTLMKMCPHDLKAWVWGFSVICNIQAIPTSTKSWIEVESPAHDTLLFIWKNQHLLILCHSPWSHTFLQQVTHILEGLPSWSTCEKFKKKNHQQHCPCAGLLTRWKWWLNIASELWYIYGIDWTMAIINQPEQTQFPFQLVHILQVFQLAWHKSPQAFQILLCFGQKLFISIILPCMQYMNAEK